MRRLVFLMVGLVGFLAACEDQPCDRYINYMCTCHENDDGFDCEELGQALGDASPELQDQCSIDLANQQDADDEAELTCSTTDDSGVNAFL